MTITTTTHLSPAQFGELEHPLLEDGAGDGTLSASTFTFPSGVAAVRLSNALGNLVMLPYQGQQVWSVHLRGRDLTMCSMFAEPRPTRAYLETYGGFLLHCGATAMGVPGTGDSHPLHGELPNAPYQEARLVLGEDARGRFIGLSGTYQHTVAFSNNYTATPLVKLYQNSSVFWLELSIHNLKQSEMALMYLAHINFRPADHARLVYSAPKTLERVRVRKSIPSHVTPKAGYEAFLEELERHPERHHTLTPGLMFDPEVVFIIDYDADQDGYAHSLHIHPDGHADYVCHRPAQLGKGVRWISRTADQDALGLVSPATAEPEGYSAEKAKGNLITLGAGETWTLEVGMGALTLAEATRMETHIAHILAP